MPDANSLASAASMAAAAVGVLLALATVAALAPRGRANPGWLSLALSAAACVLVLAAGLAVLASGQVVSARAGSVIGFAPVDLRVDSLSALFLVALGLVGAACSVFGIGYRSHAAPDRDPVAAAYPVFIAALALVFGAANVVSFLLAWELMALASAALVVGSRPDAVTARAGYLYLALTHLATAGLVVAFAMLASASGSFDLASFGPAAAGLSPAARDAVFLLLLVGFATKAGAIPFHVWLPRAHPVAPSHVSALMSGVMIKAGIYGLVRFGLEILGPGPSWWGLLVLGIGVASAVLGVLYALMENDLKRLLAFSSIENVGIILIGVGVSMLATEQGIGPLAALALAAALVHALNHAVFKSLLFLAAGAVQSGAGTRDLNRLGGLVRAMPATMLAFAIGAAAIAGLPPLNGFVGEWLTFQALVGAGADAALSPVTRSAALLAIGGLGLTAALALACFVKATGVGFLALPRSAGAAAAQEGGRSMAGAMAALAAVVVGLGLAAGPVAGAVAGIARDTLTAGTPGLADLVPRGGAAPGAAVPSLAGGPVYAAAGVGLALAFVAGAIWFIGVRGRAVRHVPTWTTGVAPEPAFEYTGASFAKLILLYFGQVLRPSREVTVELHPGTPFPRTIRYRGEPRQVLEERLYGPVHRAAVGAAQLARRLQGGSLQLYLAYSVVAVVLLLVLAR
jgi:hydrogenase-4 component B